MKNFTKQVSSTILLSFVATVFLMGQVPADQDVIIIDDGIENIGLLEKTINEDVDGDGNRINSTRIYQLKKDGVYYMQSAILFGSSDGTDTTSTLIIVGEEGGNMPMVLCQPPDGEDQWSNQVHGSLTIKNVYWPSTNLAGNARTLFSIHRSNQRLILENFVNENAFRGDVFTMGNSLGSMNVYIKNCYFRNVSKLGNSWNYAIMVRGTNGEAIDTLWVENTTVVNGGMPFFGFQNPVNFFFFDHNTVINTSKYPFWYEQLKEAYFTNNLFINANYEGECASTWATQLADDAPSGIINVDTIKNEWWLETPPPAMEDVIILASNNLHFSSPFMDNYYTGGWNDVYDYPMSNRAWGTVTEDMVPIPVSNIPVPLLGERTVELIAAYDNFKEDNNYDNTTDPKMVTKGFASQAVADEFIKLARHNYGVAEEGETYDKSMMWVGDGDGTTIPGNGTEDGGGFVDVSGFPEDFSYTADISSTIDDRPLGSLAWWSGEIDTYDGVAALEHIKKYYAGTVGVEDVVADKAASCSIYPNPSNSVLHIDSDSELNSAIFYAVTGKMVKQISLNGDFSRALDISDLNYGVYILQIETISGVSNAYKFIKK